MKNVLNDLFLRPDFDASRVAVTFTAPEGCSDSRWAILDGRPRAVANQVGQTCRITLHPFADHPELDSERRVSAVEEGKHPVYHLDAAP